MNIMFSEKTYDAIMNGIKTDDIYGSCLQYPCKPYDHLPFTYNSYKMFHSIDSVLLGVVSENAAVMFIFIRRENTKQLNIKYKIIKNTRRDCIYDKYDDVGKDSIDIDDIKNLSFEGMSDMFKNLFEKFDGFKDAKNDIHHTWNIMTVQGMINKYIEDSEIDPGDIWIGSAFGGGLGTTMVPTTDGSRETAEDLDILYDNDIDILHDIANAYNDEVLYAVIESKHGTDPDIIDIILKSNHGPCLKDLMLEKVSDPDIRDKIIKHYEYMESYYSEDESY